MPGQPNPPVLFEAFASNAPVASPAAPVAGGKTAPFPVASQIAVTPGAASLADGFPPLNMTAPSAGGLPPFGVDMNGILYLITAHVVALNAGQGYDFNQALANAMGGYAIGAQVQQLADPTATWTNLVAGNTTNPDTANPPGSTGWYSNKLIHYQTAPAAGTYNDVVLLGPSDYLFDVDCSAGPINFTGVVPQRDGQKLTFRKIDATGNAFSLQSLTGSAAGHQFQIVAAGLGLGLQYESLTVLYSLTVNAWVQI